jgi:hypothetical protein
MTHFGRAMETLNIEIICANSPQAKGRVERANATLQDRLVEAIRLEGIATIAQANAFLPAYMAQHNARFAKPAFDARDLHRPLASHDDMRVVMVWREERAVTRSLALHYNKALFILEPTEITRPLVRIPTKPPPRSEKIAPPYSEMMSPPRERGLSGIDRFGFVLGRRQAVGFVFRRRILSPSRFSRWALWTRRSRMASA